MEEVPLEESASVDSTGGHPASLSTHRAGYSKPRSPTEQSQKTDFSPRSAYVPQSPSSAQPYSTAYSGMFSTVGKPGNNDLADKSLAQDIYGAANTTLSTASQWFKRTSEPQKHLKLKRTAYLDGLRGFGALLVYILHNTGWSHGTWALTIMEAGWGWHGHYYFATAPFIRTFFSGGHLAVAVFFVISGYVLAAKPLSLIQSKETVNLADNLGSALFRRWLRLFIPVLVLTFLWMSSWHLLGFRPSVPQIPERTYLDEVWKWYCDFKNYSFIFNDSYFNAYSFHAWSIPLEFRGSIVIYTTLIAVARCNTANRLRIECALLFYFMYIVDGWYCALFIVGMLLCDLDLLAIRRELPPALKRIYTQPQWVCYILLTVALYIGNVPANSNDIMELRGTPGWYYLSFLKPQAVFNHAWFFRFWAATLLMIIIPRLGWLQSFFETPFCQYLGRISFALYLVHGPVMWSIGDRIYAAVGLARDGHDALVPAWINRFPFPNWGVTGLEVNFLASQLILFPLTLWLAEVFTRLVDEPSVKFTQWLFKTHTTPERDFLV